MSIKSINTQGKVIIVFSKEVLVPENPEALIESGSKQFIDMKVVIDPENWTKYNSTVKFVNMSSRELVL